jgi:hypothetical protein
MDIDEFNSKAYLEELHRQTGGDTEQQVSMYDVGAAIGLDRTEAGILAEQFMVQGQAELRTLAGGISITPEGLIALGIAVPSSHSVESDLRLGAGPVADEADLRAVNRLTEEIKNEISGMVLEFEQLEEIVLDLKTIEVHLLSPRPKTAVLREIFRSLLNSLEATNAVKATAHLKVVIG